MAKKLPRIPPVAPAKPVLGAFNQGATPTIACINQAKTPLGVNWAALILALQQYVDRFVAPVWGTPAKLVQATSFPPTAWALVFLDDADVSGALAYHELTPKGLPMSKVFVRTTLQNGDKVSVSASHELVEMLVDPAINLMSVGPNGRTMYAYEAADPCEDLEFLIDGIAMSDFVYPSYFEAFHRPGTVRFDQMGKITEPFQILPGGYQIIFRNNRWSEIFGSEEKKAAFKKEDRRGHRSDSRIVPTAGL